MTKILINIATRELTENINSEYIELYSDLYINRWVKIYVFYKSNDDIIESIDLNRKWIYIFKYKDYNDLEKQIISLHKNNDIIFINTFTELLIDTATNLKITLWEKVSDEISIFRNKEIQRKKLLEFNPNITVKYLEMNFDNLNISKIEDFIWYPFIIKPASWIQSAWVSKINNKNEFNEYINWFQKFIDNFESKWYKSDLLLIEEYIDWEMYSIDYFVSQNWDIVISKPVKVVLWTDLWIDDFLNYSRIVSKWVENELKNNNLNEFITDTVKWAWIRNTFIHHEFKLNSKWELKTIELNWRIGWFRPWIYKRGYNINLFDFLLLENKNYDLISNDAVINIYSYKRWFLEWFNQNLISDFNNLDSVVSIKTIESNIWKEVWLTKDWFSRIAVIKLNNKNYNTFINDYNYIKDKHQKLLNIK